MTFNLIQSICDTLVFCKKCNLICCNEYEPTVNNNMGCDIGYFNFERKYILSTYRLTKNLFDFDDVGKIITDIDGLCIYIDQKASEHIGETCSKIRFSPIWYHNLYSQDNTSILDKWQSALEEEKFLLYKEQRVFITNDNKKENVYLLGEFYPIFSKNRFKGMKGIIMRVTKSIWRKFHVNDVLNAINVNEDSKSF
jgi:hypothetical protein